MFASRVAVGTLHRPLRDRLVEEERWQLAIEMSTKCGLDSGSVWAAWGLALLRSGNWQSARDKLSRILKVHILLRYVLV